MRIGYIQNSPDFGEKQKNFKQIEKLIGEEKADVIVLPELFATGYTFTSKEEAMMLGEDLNGETARFLQKLAKQTGGLIIGGFVEIEAEKTFNSAMVVTPNKILGTYRKIHLFNKEKLWFNSGDRPFKVFDYGGIKVGVMICFDWIFPESTRTLALLGADLIAHPANLVLPYCQNAMKTRCLENHVYSITANRIGIEERGDDKFIFTGASQITSPDGNVLSSALTEEISIGFQEIDIERARNKDLNAYNNVITDRRPEFYKS